MSTLTRSVDARSEEGYMLACMAVILGLASSSPDALQDKFRPSILGIEPLRTPFSTAKQILGEVPWTREDTTEEGNPILLCYYGGPRGDRTFLLIESDASGGYGHDTVTGFHLSRGQPKHLQVVSLAEADSPANIATRGGRLCRESKSGHQEIALSNGLRLGLRRAKVVGLLGPPTSESNTTLIYVRDNRAEAPVPSGAAGFQGDYAKIEIELVGNKVTSIHVQRSSMI